MDNTMRSNGPQPQDPDPGELSYFYPWPLGPYVQHYTLFRDYAGNAYYQSHGWSLPFPLPNCPPVGGSVPLDINLSTGPGPLGPYFQPYTHVRDDISNGNIGTQMCNRPPVTAIPLQSCHGFNHPWNAQPAQFLSQPISLSILVPTGCRTGSLRKFLESFWPLDLAASRGSQEATTWELSIVEQYKAAKFNVLPQGRQVELTITYSSKAMVPDAVSNPPPFPSQVRSTRTGYRNQPVNGRRRAPHNRSSYPVSQNLPIGEQWRSPIPRSSDLTPRAPMSLERTSTNSSAEASLESMTTSSSTQAVAGSFGIRTPSMEADRAKECKPAELLPQNLDVDLLEQDVGILSLDD